MDQFFFNKSLQQQQQQQILSFTEFINLKDSKSKQMQSYNYHYQSRDITDKLNPLNTSNRLDNRAYDFPLEANRTKSDSIYSEIQNQRQNKLINDLKASHSVIEEKLTNDVKLLELTNEEKTKEIDELVKALKQEMEIKDQLQLNCDNYQKLNQKLKEMNAFLQLKITTPTSPSSTTNQSGDINKLLEENGKLKQLIALKDKVIEEISGELQEKEKIFQDITRMKEAVDKYSTQINAMSQEIELRDEIIQHLKQSLEGKGASSSKINDDNEHNDGNDSNDYKKKFEEQVELNLEMKKSFEKISSLVQSLIESKEKEKNSYAQKLNESLIKENTDLKKLNQMYKAKYDIIPKLEKRFEEVFHESTLLKEENKALKLSQGNQPNDAADGDDERAEEEKSEEENKDQKDQASLSAQKNNQIDQSIGETFTLYSISQSSLFSYSIHKKEYTQIVPDKMDDFKGNYQAKGSITYNTFEGLFIITGPEFNKLYYYSQKKNSISSIMVFKENHQYGALFLDDISKNLLVLSGTKTNSVECLSFERTELSFLPPLSQSRAKSSCCFINSVLYVFFGINDQSKQPLTNIEYLDMKALTAESKWEKMNLKSNQGNSALAFVGHSVLNLNDKQVLILGGLNQKNKPNETIFFIDLSQKIIGELNHQLGPLFKKGDCLFTSHSMFKLFFKEEIAFFANIDDNRNIHMMDANLKYDLALFSDYFQ